MPLTRNVLDNAGCGTPDCDHDHSVLYVHSRCHTGAPFTAAYIKATGILKLTCAVCERPVGEYQIAQGE